MQRRKFLVGMGSLAAGSAAAMGTGAFDQVAAERTVDVNVAGDAGALLGLDPTQGSNSAYSSISNGQISVDISNTSGIIGNGINQNGHTLLLELFEITNQGGEPAIVYVEPDSVTIDGTNVFTGSTDDYVDPQASNRPFGSNVWEDRFINGHNTVSMTAVGATDSDTTPDPSQFKQEADSKFNDGNGVDELRLDPGNSFSFGLYLEANEDTSFGSVSMTLVADTSIV